MQSAISSLQSAVYDLESRLVFQPVSLPATVIHARLVGLLPSAKRLLLSEETWTSGLSLSLRHLSEESLRRLSLRSLSEETWTSVRSEETTTIKDLDSGVRGKEEH